jgi:probable F420-dependent oxidoreductase
MYDALTLLAAIAGRTERIGLGTAVLLLGLRHPVLAAKALASIDRLSSGRLTVGVGIGGEYRPEWEAAGVEWRRRARRTDGMIEALRGLWGEGAFGMEGPGFRFAPVELEPKPVRSPPIWIGGRSEAALRRAGRLGDGWMGIFTTPERYADGLARARERAAEAGRDPSALVPSLYVWTCFGPTHEEARALAAAVMPSFYRVPFEKLERYAVIGTAEQCAEAFAAFAASGVRHFAVAPVLDRVTPEPVDRLAEVTALMGGGG